MQNQWINNGAREGLYYAVTDGEKLIKVAVGESADELVAILNSLERDAAFGRQCIQDDCEGAWIAATVHNDVKTELARLRESNARLHDLLQRIDKILDTDDPNGYASDDPLAAMETVRAAIAAQP